MRYPCKIANVLSVGYALSAKISSIKSDTIYLLVGISAKSYQALVFNSTEF